MKFILLLSSTSLNATCSLVVHTFPDSTYIASTGLPQSPKEIRILEAKIRMVQEMSKDMCA